MSILFVVIPNTETDIDHLSSVMLNTSLPISRAGGKTKEKPRISDVAVAVVTFSVPELSGDMFEIFKDILKEGEVKYFGLIIWDQSENTFTWRSSNFGYFELEEILDRIRENENVWNDNEQSSDPESDEKLSRHQPKNNEPPPEPEPEPEPETEDNESPSIDMDLLLKVLKKSCEISDIFFDNITKENRKILTLEVEKLRSLKGNRLENMIVEPTTPAVLQKSQPQKTVRVITVPKVQIDGM